MYSTHSDESYTPDDGTYSLWEGAGIYDVGNALKDELEARGIETIYSEESFLPHDADAYNRSRATAEELLKRAPDALLDIHRDAIPRSSMRRPSTARTSARCACSSVVQPERRCQPRLRPAHQGGRRRGVSRADQGHLHRQGQLQSGALPAGTAAGIRHDEIEKDKAIGATEYMADVLDQVLYGESARAESEADAAPAAKGIFWVIGIAVLGAAIYGLVSTGRLSGMWDKLKPAPAS